jgi:hypothetical protein
MVFQPNDLCAPFLLTLAHTSSGLHRAASDIEVHRHACSKHELPTLMASDPVGLVLAEYRGSHACWPIARCQIGTDVETILQAYISLF